MKSQFLFLLLLVSTRTLAHQSFRLLFWHLASVPALLTSALFVSVLLVGLPNLPFLLSHYQQRKMERKEKKKKKVDETRPAPSLSCSFALFLSLCLFRVSYRFLRERGRRLLCGCRSHATLLHPPMLDPSEFETQDWTECRGDIQAEMTVLHFSQLIGRI